MTIKAWRRPAYFEKVIARYAEMPESKEIPIILSLDSAEHSVQQDHVGIMKRYGLYDNADISLAEQPRGCAGSTIYVMKKAFEEHNADAIMHLEDDSVPARDYIQYMTWTLKEMDKDKNYFAVCPYTRRAANRFLPDNPTLEGSFSRAWFEASGGFGLTRRIWDFLESMGGMFGTHSPNMPENMVGHAWKSIMPITDQGSWAWPYNAYFRKDSQTEHLCIYPDINRTENIGANGGVFCPGDAWHKDHMKNEEHWVGNTKYDSVDFTNINYTLDTHCVGSR